MTKASSPLDIIILGLSITSSWGNGHATTYRALVRELDARGHDLLFLERDVPWYAANRDLPDPPYGHTELYTSFDDLRHRFTKRIRYADLVIVGSYLPEGVRVGEWVTSIAKGLTCFYDIDTPVTLAKLESETAEYLSRELVPRYDMYLSFTGGSTLDRLEQQFGSPMARVLYCSIDPELYYPEESRKIWDLGYLGTYSEDRQRALDVLMLEPARRWPSGCMVVAGPLYPEHIAWPLNVERTAHLSPQEHRAFYNAQRFTLNITRAAMIRAGHSPSVRLFEAAACGTTIISDCWQGLDALFEIGKEILVARSPQDVLHFLRELPESERRAIGRRARARTLRDHTAAQRAAQLEFYIDECKARKYHHATTQGAVVSS